MKLTFHGGAKSVTGANYLLESGSSKILIDCGLEQGRGFCELENWNPFGYDPKKIDAVFITHAHIDHTGRLPKLTKYGFRGAVYATPPTRDAAELLLKDSDHIMADEAARCKKEILFSNDDIDRLMVLWQPLEYHKPLTVGPFKVTLFNSGHILGSSSILVECEGKKIIFSGDLGNSPGPFTEDPEEIKEADYAILESVYGDRIHEDLPTRKELLEDIIEETLQARGVLMIPAFALERTQQLIYEIHDLITRGRIPSVPVFLDSPLAIRLTEIYRKYDRYLRHESEVGAHNDPGHLFAFPFLHETIETEQSKAIANVKGPKIIIAGSGMSHGGRIIHHEKQYLSDPKSTLLIMGYQAKGSLGRELLDGATTVTILGEEIIVKARIVAIGGYSAHADQRQLLNWIRPMRKSLKKIFVVQGEDEAAIALARRCIDDFAVSAIVPDPHTSFEL